MPEHGPDICVVGSDGREQGDARSEPGMRVGATRAMRCSHAGKQAGAYSEEGVLDVGRWVAFSTVLSPVTPFFASSKIR